MEKIIKTGALFVLSDYNWLPLDIKNSWVEEYTDNYLILDRYHRFEENDKIKWQDNVGQNVYDIFDFSHKNYNNLPELVIFCRAVFLRPKDDGIPKYDETGNKISNGNCSEEFFKKIVNNTFFTEIHDFGPEVHERYKNQSRPASKLADDNFGYLELNNSWYVHSHPTKFFSNLDQLFSEIFENYTHLEYVRFSPGANYIIPKNHILKYNSFFYETMKKFIGWDVITGEAHMFERAIYTIFNSNFKIKNKYKNQSYE